MADDDKPYEPPSWWKSVLPGCKCEACLRATE